MNLDDSEDDMQEKRRTNLSAIQAQILHELEHMNRRVCTASDSIETGSSSAHDEQVSREIENCANVVAMFKKDTAILTNLPELASLSRFCDHQHQHTHTSNVAGRLLNVGEGAPRLLPSDFGVKQQTISI